MQIYKNIMVGIDGSEPSNKALKEAAELAKETGADLHIFHAVAHHFQMPSPLFPVMPQPISMYPQQPPTDPLVLQKYYEEAGKVVIAHAKKFLEDLNLSIDGKIEFQLELEISPEEYAVDYAKKKQVDLIVVGCKGHHSRTRRVLLGTVASKIVNEAPCQVLVVR